jgi:diguanylate cyclase (GGDEF)-like protein/PAS domain S-box-containing protein
VNIENLNSKCAEGLFEALLNSTVVSVFLYQDNGKIILSNKTFRDFIGYSEDELSQLAPYDIVTDEYKTLVKKIVERRINGEVFTAEQIAHNHITKDGVIKPTVIFGYTIFYNGRPAGLVLLIDVYNKKMYDSLFSSFNAVKTMYATLSEVNQLIVRSKDENYLFSEICNRIVERGLFVDSLIILFDQGMNFKRSFSYGKSDYIEYLKLHLNTPEAKKGPSITSFSKSKIAINNDTLKNSFMLPWKDEQVKRGYFSSAAIPIKKKNKTIGTLSLYSDKKGFFKKDTYSLLKEIMTDINYALDKIEDEKWHSMISVALNAGSDFIVIADKYFDLLYLNESAYKIFGYIESELVGEHYSKIFEGGSGKKEFAAKFLGTLLSGDALTDIFIYRTKDNKTVYGFTTITPFKAEDGAEYYIAVGKDITSEIKSEETIEKLLYFDALTGLPNKKFLAEKIDASVNIDNKSAYDDAPCAFVIINPVNFSFINHAFGVETGNQIMSEIAKRIKKNVKDYDIPAKWEADKFAVFLKNLKADEDALHITERILAALGEPYAPAAISANDGNMTETKHVNVSFNAGISLYPKDAVKSQDIFNKAEAALLNAKTKGENAVGFFKKEFQEYAIKKVELRNGLKEAIAKKEFVLHYQPYFDAQTGDIKGAEALLRWQRAERLVPPMEFIAFLEQSGIITEVEKWIIGELTSKTKIWIEGGLKVVPISINISPVSFGNPSFKSDIANIIETCGLRPDFFNLEIVERTFIENFDYSVTLLNLLKKMGFGLSIDDFGTGYSSLSYLADLPFDILKIDISFVRKMLIEKHSRYLVETIIYLSKKLNMKSIAEGVETEEQLALLKTLGCDYIQGFLLSKPLNEKDFEKLLA